MQDSCRLTERKKETQVRRERRYFWGPILSSSRGGSDYTNMSGSRLLGCSKVVSAFRVVRASERASSDLWEFVRCVLAGLITS